jgi:uncharacterized protein (UPF0264 family)
MRLLVSVSDATEAMAALEGGAHYIDAKNPWAGALGAVPVATLDRIRDAIGGVRPITAALGDLTDEAALEDAARVFATSGPAFVKVGFSGATSPRQIFNLIRAAVRGATKGGRGRTGVVAVAYADTTGAGTLTPLAMVEEAACAGAAGVLIDTRHKGGPGLRSLIDARGLCAFVARAHGSGLLAALAGQLALADLSFVRDSGADVAGVRGAACDGGRNGSVSARRVRELRELLDAIECQSSSADRSSSARPASTTMGVTPAGIALEK